MLTFAAPWLLLGGALAALVPLALHLIRRRPPVRAPLPTARFLSPDPRTSVRVARPADPLLLALRMLLLVLAGAALSRPAWHPARRGTADVVLLDRGLAAAGLPWRNAVAAARARLIGADGGARGALVLFGDTADVVAGRRLSPTLFDSLASRAAASPASSYSAALGAIPAAVRALPQADSVRVTLVAAPRWSAWDDGLVPLRRAVFPGAFELVDVPLPPVADGPLDSLGMTALYLARDPARATYARTALEAAGWTVRVVAPTTDAPLMGATLIVAAQPVPSALAPALRARAADGATVLVAAPAADSLRPLLGWPGAMRPDNAAGALRFADGTRLAGAPSRLLGWTMPSVPLATWDDGQPAAAARREGRGCVVFVGTDVETGEMTLDGAYPRALSRLARGCEGGRAADDAAPLDAGARAVLRGRGARVVAAGAVLGAREGVPLGRWIMAAALLVALGETILAYGRRKAG